MIFRKACTFLLRAAPVLAALGAAAPAALASDTSASLFGILAPSLVSDVEAHPLRDVSYALAVTLAVVVAIAAWNVVLRRRVAVKTAKLRATELRFAAILNNLPEFAWVKDPEGRFLAVNASFARLCGETDPEAMAGRSLSEYFPPDMVEHHRRNDELMRARMAAMVTVDPVTDAGGARAWMETTQAPFFDGTGAYAGTVGISRDITARKQAEDALSEALEALRSSESRYRDLLAALPVGVFESDGDGNIIFANDLGLTLMGGAEPQHRAGAWVDLVHPEDRAATAEAVDRLIAEGAPLNLECRAAGGNPRPVWIQALGIRRRDTGGAIISVADISARRQASECLRVREEEFRVLAELSPDTIARYDADCRRLYVNPALAVALGDTKDALLGRTPSQTGLSGQFQDFEAKIRNVVATGRDDVFELTWVIADGSPMISDIRLVPERDKDGAVVSVIAIGRDVTRLKTVEAELRANAARLSTLIDNIPGTCFSVRYPPGGQKEFLYESGVGAQLVGMSPEEMPAHFHPDDRALLFEEVPERLRRSGYSEHTFRRLHGGTVVWRHARERVRTWEGDAMIVDGVSFDITAEMEAKLKLERTTEDLRATAQRLGAILDNLPGMAYRKEYGPADSTIVYFSGGYRSLTGTDVAPLTYEERLANVWHPDDHEKIKGYVSAIRAGADSAELQLRFFHADGSIRWVLVRERVQERRGDWIAAEGLLIDITEEMEAKQKLEANADELRRMTRRLETLLNNLPGSVFRMEYLPNGKKRILEMFGNSVHSTGNFGDEDELMGLVHPDDVDLIYPQFTARLRAHGAAEETFRLMLPDGGFRWVRTRERVCERIGDRMIVEGQIFDVTAETLMEQDLKESERRRQRAEARLRQGRRFEALGQFAGGVAHDFNNLLGAILGYSRFIQEDSAPDSSAHRHAARIIAAGNKGRAIVEQIMNYSRQVELTPSRFTVGALIAEVVQLCDVGGMPHVTLATDCSLGDLEIEADHVQLTRLLMNLCVNACDALDGGPGTILIGARQSEVDAAVLQRLIEREEGGDGSDVEVWTDASGLCWLVAGRLPKVLPPVSLYVADTGVGMDAKLFETAFTPFFTTKDRSRGTGLGLAVVHGIVLAHGGALVGRSRPGEGTRFEVLLPCRRSPCEPASLFVPLDARPEVRVMLVDDNVDLADATAEALTRLDYLVDTFSDPAAALEALRAVPDAWDLLITDQIMPGLRGTDLIREARAIRPDLPCLLCSGYAEELNAATSRKIGANEMLRKPFELDELLGAIGRAVSSGAGGPGNGLAA
ncbi:MAG TPA: PAS domain S-box protein [Azospirillum sp.]|nr:PAS domain S-box protein [Azospirillum sp.]